MRDHIFKSHRVLVAVGFSPLALMSSLEHPVDDEYPFSQITLSTPVGVQGGAYFSIWSMTRKLAYALGLFVGTSLVVFWGFDSLADPLNTTNTPFALLMLAITYSVIPAVFKFVAMPLLWNYPLTEEKVAEIQEQMKSD